MAISHNLSDASNNASGYDPGAGLSGTIGRTYLMWLIFDAWRTFDTRITLITNTTPTPTFLQGEVGNVVTAPAQSASTANQSIRFYMSDDPGLAETPANAIVYELNTSADIAGNTNLICIRLRFAKNGSTTYAPTGVDVFVDDDTSTTVYTTVAFVGIGWATATTTIPSQIPYIIFYKSDNLFGLMAIRKDTLVGAGGGLFIKPNSPVGYVNNSGVIDRGVNWNGVAFIPTGNGGAEFEGFVNTQSGNFATQSGNLEMIPMAGYLPTTTYTISGVSYLLSGVVRMAQVLNASFKIISEELEGLVYASGTALTPSLGAIAIYNNKYYLLWSNVVTNAGTWRMALELEAV